jgi:hypothetical protein
MSLQLYLAFVAACIALALLPGPMVTLVIANGLRHGTRAALTSNCCVRKPVSISAKIRASRSAHCNRLFPAALREGFLITNWHVVTGLNMMDGKTIGNHWVPERIVLRHFTKRAPQLMTISSAVLHR